MAKPPSLAKRRGLNADGINQYRLLFSLWNSETTTYVSWQHMASPIVVRNSFHMLPLQEKEYRRQQYAKSRSADKDIGSSGELDAPSSEQPSSRPTLSSLRGYSSAVLAQPAVVAHQSSTAAQRCSASSSLEG